MKRKTVAVDIAALVEGMRLCGRTSLGDIADGANLLGISADAKGGAWTATRLLHVMARREPTERTRSRTANQLNTRE